jgi:CheY-like chemotaxis protein
VVDEPKGAIALSWEQEMSDVERPAIDQSATGANPKNVPKTSNRKSRSTTVRLVKLMIASQRKASAESFLALSKGSGIILIILWATFHQTYIASWLENVTDTQVLGVTLKRQNVDQATKALKKVEDQVNENAAASGPIDDQLLQATLARAVRAAPAIVDAQVLWVDDKPENNLHIASFLHSIGIKLKSVGSTKDALESLRTTPYSLVITNVFRRNDPGKIPLKKCRVYYFDFPTAVDEHKFTGSSTAERLAAFNAQENQSGPAGYSLLEQLALDRGATAPRTIVFSAENASISRSLCGDIITNRFDILLHSIVSLLEEARADKLRR